jgi:RimJ/RimL family protein N-acetyltransferase
MLSLRNFRVSDINKAYLSWLNNKELMRYSRHSKILYNREKALNFFKKIKEENNFFFLICLNHKNKKKKIGTLIGYTDKKNKSCNLGILISEQGKGYGKKAYKLAINYIFKNGYKTIIGGSLSSNIAMIKIFKSSGMKFIKEKKIYYPNLKKKRKMVIYKIIKLN